MGSSGPAAPDIYRKPNSKYAVYWRHAGRLRFRTVESGLLEARRTRAGADRGDARMEVPVSPRPFRDVRRLVG